MYDIIILSQEFFISYISTAIIFYGNSMILIGTKISIMWGEI